MSDDIAISVQGVSKDFHYNSNRANSVKGILTGIFKEKENQKDIQHALKDISFEVRKGEFFGIVGRNGSGKSTLLKIMAGIYQPNKGSVQINGKLVPFIELGVGFNPELTGKENVYLNGALLGFSKKEISAMYNEIVEFAELEKFMNQKLKNYSSGMQVRLAFSMAVRAKADILLIDEVLAVGDADFQRKCFEYFKELKHDKKTVIFVSHDMSAVREYCDRAALVDRSILIDLGETDMIASKYTKLFIKQQEAKDKESAQKLGERWGDGKIKLTEVSIDKAQLKKADRAFRIKVVAESNKDIPHQIAIGYMIKNSAGQPVMGSNTAAQKQNIRKVQEGERTEVIWIIPNIFGQDKYSLDVAITSIDGTITHDWWEACASFRVYNDEHTPYIVTPQVSVSVNRKKA